MRIRSSGQLALIGGIYACIRGCGTLVRAARGRSLPGCGRCAGRTAWVLWFGYEARSAAPSSRVAPAAILSVAEGGRS